MMWRYRVYTAKQGVQKVKTKAAIAFTAVGLAVAGGGGLSMALLGTAHAAPLTVAGCNFDSHAGTWTLQADCTSTAQINVPTATVVDGNGYTISAGFAKTNNSNNSVLGVAGDNNVTIENLTIDGSGGTNLHGINAYVSTNVTIENVAINNINRTAINVNGAEVTVSKVTTANSGWDGFDVDQGSGVTTSAVLNVNGPVNQANETNDIYVDDTSKDVTVNDTLHQYVYQDNVQKAGDRLYTLKSSLNRDDCTNGNWAVYGFNNQGQCVALVNHNNGVGQDDKHAHNR